MLVRIEEYQGQTVIANSVIEKEIRKWIEREWSSWITTVISGLATCHPPWMCTISASCSSSYTAWKAEAPERSMHADIVGEVRADRGQDHIEWFKLQRSLELISYNNIRQRELWRRLRKAFVLQLTEFAEDDDMITTKRVHQKVQSLFSRFIKNQMYSLEEISKV